MMMMDHLVLIPFLFYIQSVQDHSTDVSIVQTPSTIRIYYTYHTIPSIYQRLFLFRNKIEK